MNRKIEDKLIELAFGDLDSHEGARLEAIAAADPEAREALEAYRAMRFGLRDLSEVPADQLSKERLRNAILGQGLKPASARSPWREWLWMPAAACLVAFGLMVFRQNQTVGTPEIVVGNFEPSQVSPYFDPLVDPLQEAAKVAAALPAASENLDTPQVAARPARPTLRRRTRIEAPSTERRGAGTGLVADLGSAGTNIVLAGNIVVPVNIEAAKVDGGMGGAADAGNLVRPREGTAVNPPSIVLIEETKDVETGAFRAVEVKESNVVIGG